MSDRIIVTLEQIQAGIAASDQHRFSDGCGYTTHIGNMTEGQLAEILPVIYAAMRALEGKSHVAADTANASKIEDLRRRGWSIAAFTTQVSTITDGQISYWYLDLLGDGDNFGASRSAKPAPPAERTIDDQRRPNMSMDAYDIDFNIRMFQDIQNATHRRMFGKGPSDRFVNAVIGEGIYQVLKHLRRNPKDPR